MAVDVLGGRVHDDSGAEIQRPLQHWRGEGIVNGQRDSAPFAHIRNGPQIHQAKQRIRRRFQPHQARARGQRSLQPLRLTQVHEAGGNSSGPITLSKMRNVPP